MLKHLQLTPGALPEHHHLCTRSGPVAVFTRGFHLLQQLQIQSPFNWKERPWLFDILEGVVYIQQRNAPTGKNGGEKNNPMFPETDRLIQKLNLTPVEKKQLVAFLNTLTGVPYRMRRPQLPE